MSHSSTVQIITEGRSQSRPSQYTQADDRNVYLDVIRKAKLKMEQSENSCYREICSKIIIKKKTTEGSAGGMLL